MENMNVKTETDTTTVAVAGSVTEVEKVKEELTCSATDIDVERVKEDGTVCKETNTPMTIEQARELPLEQLLSMKEQVKGHTAKFKTCFNVDFSYSTLNNIINEKTQRTDVTGANKKADDATVIEIRKEEGETVRKTLSMSKEVSEEWSEFSKQFPYQTVVTNAALSMFMNACRTGEVRFVFKVQ